MTELTRADFAKGVNDAIRALRAVYSGVRTMLDELAVALEDAPCALYDLGVRARPVTSRANPDEKSCEPGRAAFMRRNRPRLTLNPMKTTRPMMRRTRRTLPEENTSR